MPIFSETTSRFHTLTRGGHYKLFVLYFFVLVVHYFPVMPRTYCEGPKLKVTRDINRKEYMEMLEAIEHELNSDHDPKEQRYRVLPEKICEGGFELVSYPGHEEGQYKVMRHWLLGPDGKQPNPYPWPHIESTVEEMLADWKANGSSHIFLSKGSKANTFLKAFKGAPLWTQEELRSVTYAMQSYGITHTRIPGKSRLKARRS